MGIQLYWGGQAVKIILGGLVGPKWVNLANTLPPSAHVDTASLISFFIFFLLFAPTLLVPPEKLQMAFRVGHRMMLMSLPKANSHLS
jgi:NCS1 family nucleobase:cation symporter-1